MKKIRMLIILSAFILGVSGCSSQEDDLVETELETQEEVDIEEETDETSESANKTLSTDLYSFQVSVNDVVYQFPTSLDTFESSGWKYEEDANENLESGSYLTAQFAEFDDFKVFVDVINFAAETREVKDSYIGGINFQKYYLNESDVEIVLPGGISFNKSSLEDIEAAYGKPSDVHEADLFTKYSYGSDMYKKVELTVFKDTGVLEEVHIRNFTEPEDLAEAEVVKETPDLIANYEYPKSISDDLFDYHLEYDGIIYEMPIPVAKLMENGWKDMDSDEQALPSNSFSSINLMKDNQTVPCYIMNYFDFLTIKENTHVIKIESREEGPKVPIKLSHGISLGMDREEFKKAISAYDYKVEDFDKFESYRLDDPDVVNSGFSIRLDKDTNSVASIVVEYDPGRLD